MKSSLINLRGQSLLKKPFALTLLKRLTTLLRFNKSKKELRNNCRSIRNDNRRNMRCTLKGMKSQFDSKKSDFRKLKRL